MATELMVIFTTSNFQKKKIQYITENVSDPDANRSIIQGSTYINNQRKLAATLLLYRLNHKHEHHIAQTKSPLFSMSMSSI